jgi:NAD(P)-dependent dehydrogenase (short-subunit alcohol dehydrogenase family)
MDLGLQGRIAAITGASKGIGYVCAETLLREGASVAICGRDSGRLEDEYPGTLRMGTGRGVMQGECLRMFSAKRRLICPRGLLN